MTAVCGEFVAGEGNGRNVGDGSAEDVDINTAVGEGEAVPPLLVGVDFEDSAPPEAGDWGLGMASV